MSKHQNKSIFFASRTFMKHYWQFSIALSVLIVTLVLQLTPFADIARWTMGILALILTVPMLRRMWNDIRRGHYGVDILAATAIITSVLLNEQWAAILVVLMLTGGEALEDYAGRRAQSELRALLAHAPVLARLVQDKKVVDIDVKKIVVDNIIEIRSGDVVPTDAVIVEGSTSVDESSLTGESLPQFKKVGDEILSGSIVIDGVLRAKAIRTAENSQYHSIHYRSLPHRWYRLGTLGRPRPLSRGNRCCNTMPIATGCSNCVNLGHEPCEQVRYYRKNRYGPRGSCTSKNHRVR